MSRVCVINASTCGVVMAMFALYQAARRYAIRCLRRVFRFDPATICLALAFVFSTAVGAMAQSITITADAGPDRTVASGATVTLDGSGSTASDGTTLYYIWIIFDDSAEHVPGFSSRSGKVQTFTAPNLEPGAADVTISFILQVRDRPGFIGGVSSGDTVTITVEAPNAPPVPNAGPDQTIKPGRKVTLDGTGSTDDDRIASYSWNRTGGTCTETTVFGGVSSLTGTNALPSFTAETLASGVASCTHDFILFVTDNDGVLGGTSDSVTVTIIATAENQRPIARVGANQTVASGTGFLLDGVGSTDDGAIGEYEWWRLDPSTGDIGLLVRNPGSITGVFVTEDILPGNADIVFTYYLNVKDNEGTSCEKQIAGGNNGELFCDSVAVTVTAPFATPVARAVTAESEYASGATVTLDGSGSSVDRRRGPISHAWARTGGTTGGSVTLSDKNVAKPTFTADTLAAGAEDVIHIFTLTVTDKEGAADTDTVTVTVKAPDVPNAGPIANPGSNQTVASGATVTLDGSGSTTSPGRTITWYAWGVNDSSVSGCDDPPPSLSNAPLDGKARLSFTAEVLESGAADVTYCIDLSVRDSAGGRSPFVRVKVTVEAPPANKAPVANAGPDQTIKPGRTVTLDGTGSTDDDRIASYSWNRTGGTCTVTTVFGGVSSLTGTNALPSFTAETLASGIASCTHDFKLFVTDNDGVLDGTGDSVTVTIIATAENQPPIARGGANQTVASGATVTLDGRLSSDDGSIATYLWNVTSPDQVKIPPTDWRNGTTATPSFTAETLESGAEDVIYHFSLRVQDNEGLWSNIDHMTVTVEASTAPVNEAPVANAGPDQLEVVSGTTVQLDGSGSSVDPRRTATYSWVRTGGTTGGMVTFSPSATVESPTFPTDTLTESDSDVTHIFTLTVTDSEGEMATDMVTIIVKAPVPDTTKPTGTITALGLAQNNHDGMTPINFQVVFDEPVLGFTAEDIDRNPWNVPDDEDKATHTATISKFMVDPTNPLRYTFTLTPGVDSSGSGSRLAFTVSIPQDKITDAIGNKNLTIRGPHLTYSAPSANTRPVAHAGVDQTKRHGELVTLDGSGSMDKEGEVTYSWARTGVTTGVTVNLSNTKAEMPTFTANAPPGTVNVVHIFTLTVTDVGGLIDTDTVMVVILSPFLTLTANAGVDQEVVSGATVTLDGSASIVDGRTSIAQYSWARTEGTGGTVTLNPSATVVRPTFTADTLAEGAADVTHIFTLTVTDNEDNTSTDTVTITVTAPVPADTTAPTAMFEGPTTHDGKTPFDMAFVFSEPVVGFMADDVVRTPYDLPSSAIVSNYRPAISNFRKDSTNALRYTFTLTPKAPNALYSPYDFDLRIPKHRLTDGAGNQNERIVGPIVIYSNVDPVANAGTDQTVTSEAMVELDGSGSTDNGTIASHAWARTGGTTGGSVTLSDTKVAKPTFTADALAAGAKDVIHIFTLTVTDNEGATDTDTVTITVEAPDVPNAGPIANPGSNQTVASGATVTLDGSGSTASPGSTINWYNWTADDSTVSGCDDPPPYDGGIGTSPRLSFIAETLAPDAADVTYCFALSVRDSAGGRSPFVGVKVTVEAPDAPRVAAAGDDQTVAAGATVTLDGSGSTVVNGPISEYSWTRESGTSTRTTIFATDSGGTTNQREISTPTTTFVADSVPANGAAVTHVIALRVLDADGIPSPKDEITVTVNPNQLPIANAGVDRSFDSGVKVMLEGSGTDSDSDATLTYSWAWTSGTGASVTLTDANTATPSFTAEVLDAGAADITHTFTLTVTDNNGETDTDTVTVTITAPSPPPNAKPTAVVTVTGGQTTVQSGAAVEITGTGTDSDSDDDTLDYAWTRTGGTGNAAVALTGKDTKTLSFTADTLVAGTVDKTHVFELVVTDDKGAESVPVEVTITIESAIAAPVAKAVTDQSEYVSGATVTLDGSGSTVDFRKTPRTFAWARTSGTGDSNLTLTNPNAEMPTFTADTLVAEANPVTHTFTLTVTDRDNRTATDTVEVTITSPFADPVANAVITGGHTMVTSGGTVMLDGRGSTKDRRRTLTHAWADETPGVTASLTNADEAVATFTAEILAADAPDVTHTFTLTVTDSAGETDTATVMITVTSGFVAPVAIIAGGNRSVATGTPVTLDGSGSTFDSRATVTYGWTRTGGTGMATLALTGEDTARLNFMADALTNSAEDVTHEFTLTVTDNKGGRSTATVTITVTSGFVAYAGPDQTITSNFPVVLDGSGSRGDSNGGPVASYAWERTDGTSTESVMLNNSNVAMPSFTADFLERGAEDVTHVFTLTVTDSMGRTSTDMVTITIISQFALPDADAGDDRTVSSGTTVKLDGSGTTVDRRSSVAYTWIRSGGDGAPVTLSNMNVEQPTFTAVILEADADDVTLEFTLTVTDSKGRSDSDTVTITVTDPFDAPVANAGVDREYGTGTLVTLDGSGSTVDSRRTIKSYLWERKSGTGGSVTLSDASAEQPTFTADTLADGDPDVTHDFTLIVTDSADQTSTDMVTITVTSGNAVPVAHAGMNQEVVSGAMVTLDGNKSSDSDGTIKSYTWTRTGGTGGTVTLTDETTAMPSFTADTLVAGAADVTHVFELVVTDNENAVSVAASVKITVTAPFKDPVADAGSDRTVAFDGNPVTLDGRASTKDRRRSLDYAWTRTGGSGGSAPLVGRTTAQPSFTPAILKPGAADGIYIFTLTVTDNAGDSDTATVRITVTSEFAAPDAIIAGGNRELASGATIQLDGSGSTFDFRRTPLTYSWNRTGGTSSSIGTLTGAMTAMPNFTAEARADGAEDVTHILTLTVTDSNSGIDTATVTITVTSGFATPVAEAGDPRSVGSGETVMLDGGRSMVDFRRTPPAYSWARTGGTSSATGTLTRATTATPDFTAETRTDGAEDVTHILTLTVTDSANVTATDTVTITVTSGFAAPVAEAGDSLSVDSGKTVMLDGGRSMVDFRRTPPAYSWARTGGTSSATGTLTDAMTATPDFTAEIRDAGAEDVTHILTLTVTDSANVTATDTVTITVTAPFADPVAKAVITGGHTSVTSGGTVMLDGNGSTKDRRRTIASYAWAGETPEVTADLTNADMAVATFTAETLTAGAPDVTHTFTLTVTDSAGASDTATVMITVTSNAIPVATVTGGNQTVASGAAVTLTGSGTDTDSDNETLDYKWTRTTRGTSTNAPALTGEGTKTLSFTADTLEAGARDVTHILELVVTDDKGAKSAPVEVTITIESAIAEPVARAVTSRSEYASGAMVTLDGNGSTVDFRKTPKTHNWARTDGTGDSNLTLTNADKAEATFTADTLVAGALDVTHTFTLTVTDSDNRMATDTVEVTINAPFADPVANAVITGGHTRVASGETVMLDGNGSTKDRRRTIASYAWAGETPEVTADLTNADMAEATFTAETLVAGAPDVTHTFTLTVTDSAGASATATVMITVNSNAIPVATVTGGNQIVASEAAVTLTGSGTDSDSDDDMLTYAWVRTSGTGNAAVTLTGKDTKTLSFTADALVPGAPDVTHVFELVVTDDKGAKSAPVEVTVTIESAIADPVARAVTTRSEYTSGAMVTLDGNGSTVDFRKEPGTFAWARTSGTGDSNLTLTSADMAMATFTADTLVAGALDVTHTFTLTVRDSDNREASDTVEVTINSPFADPVASAVITGGHTTVASGETVMLDGNGSTKDRRRTIASYAWAGETPEVTADLTNADMAEATFTAETLVAGAPGVTHTFTLTVTDSAGASDTATVTIMVISNALPIATVTGGNQIVASGAAVTLTGSGTDSDSDDDMLTYAWVRTGGTGNAAVALTGEDTKTLSFTADTLVAGTVDKTHVFELVVTDDKGTESTPVEVTITIESAIAVPVARAVTAQPEYASGATVTLDGSGSTVDFRKTPKTHSWMGETPEITASLTRADEAMATFTADTLVAGAPDVTHTFTLTVRDSDNRMATDTVEVTINAPFANPVANAGDDQDNIAPGATVTLDGSGSTKDRRRTITSYAWARTGGTTGSSATLSSMTAERPTFTADSLTPGADDVTHTFTLTVTDSAGVTDMDMVEITVISRFAPPVANAGADQNNIASGATVTLDGSGSTKDRRKTLDYSWARTGGTGGVARLSSTTAEQPTFTAETLNPGAPDVTYIFTLTVTDDTARDDATVTITVISPFKDPVANAVTTRPEVGPGDTVILDGSGSTKDRRRTITSYAWARTGGTGANVTLTGATEAMASFTADMLAAGAENVTHTFTLTVTDSAGEIATDTVEVIVTANVRPVATLTGPATLTVAAGASVTLEGSGTDRDNNVPLAYEWDRTGGTGNSAVVLTGKNTTTLSFTAETLPAGAEAVTHIFEFVVTDNEGAESDPVTVTVTVDAPNAIPVAHAGPPPPPVASGGQIQLDGRGSRVPGGTIVAWAWTRTGGTLGVTVTLTGANTAQPTVMANDLEPGGPDEIHEFTLVVTDDEGMTSVGATVMVTISAPIAAPVANAGPDQRAVSRATVRLDGRGSTPDRRKTITSYAWERTGGTGDSNLTLTGANTAQPTFTADTLNPGVDAITHVFTLTVTDEDGTTSTDTVMVTVVSVDIRLSQSEIMVQEGGSGTYQVKLSESPLREVTIMAVSGNEDVVKLNNARLVFDNGNWNEWQDVEINTVAGFNTNDPVVIRHRLVTAGATSPVPGDVTVTLRSRADDPVPRPVGQFLQTRATALINNQPGLSSLLESDGPTPGGGNFTFQATDGRLAMNGEFNHDSVWGKVTGAYASSESAADNTGSVTKSVLASFGVHRKYSERFLAGIMLQFDLADHDRAGQVGRTDTIDGTGWLVGPYFATRHRSQPLYYEGRLLYGQSDNDIRFMDAGLGRTRTGSFDTRRLLAQIRVEGEIAMSGRNRGHDEYNEDNGHKNGPRLRPYADLRWVEDRAEAFTDNIRNRVPGQSVSIGQLELGSNIEIPMAVRTGELTFIGGLGLVYSKTEGDYILSDSSAHGRGEIGFSYDLDDNLRIDLDSFYDGIGTSRYEGYGLSLSAEMKF